MMIVRHHRPDNGQGWRLDLKQCHNPNTLVPGRRPLVIIPGYGMNAFIFGFHPTGIAMERYLVNQGFEVWSVNMRGQGASEHLHGPKKYGFKELALVDLPCIFKTVLEHTNTGQDRLDPIGCSLGAALTYIYLSHHLQDHPIGTMAAVGGPLRWQKVHPLVKVAFTSPRLAGAIPVRGTRKMARMVLPVAKRMPALLSIYMNARQIDLGQPDRLVQTVEDPDQRLNRQMAHWIKGGDLIVSGINVTEALRALRLPLFCVYANADGVVPPATASSITQVMPRSHVEVLEGGDKTTPCAHADLFISRQAQERVFEPLSRWFARHAAPQTTSAVGG